MPRRRPLTLFEAPPERTALRIEVGARSLWVLGLTRVGAKYGTGLADDLANAGIPHMWCSVRKALTCPADRLDDLLAVLERDNFRVVDLTAVDR